MQIVIGYRLPASATFGYVDMLIQRGEPCWRLRSARRENATGTRVKNISILQVDHAANFLTAYVKISGWHPPMPTSHCSSPALSRFRRMRLTRH
jgi:hypothetical protein